MNKILYIVGPTATGKTSLALKLARKYNGDLISADSRQVYRGMDIGTGKDIPINFQFSIFNFQKNKKDGYYTDGKMRIWGLDLVEPDEEFSVVNYVRFAVPVIQQIWQDEKLPIIVGGTGLYIRALIRDLPEIFIPQNKKLRQKLYSMSVRELQKSLAKLNITKFNSMNESDRQNPRRLVRAIEIGNWKSSVISHQSSVNKIEEILSSDKLLISLTAEREEIYRRIDQRVEERVKQGIVKEIQSLLAKGYTWELPAFSALGYDIWQEYIVKRSKRSETEQKKLKQEIIQKWKLNEHQYARRQMTWFKKELGIEWFDVSDFHYADYILKEVGKWYNRK